MRNLSLVLLALALSPSAFAMGFDFNNVKTPSDFIAPSAREKRNAARERYIRDAAAIRNSPVVRGFVAKKLDVDADDVLFLNIIGTSINGENLVYLVVTQDECSFDVRPLAGNRYELDRSSWSCQEAD